jgi:hypothetical protein
MPSPEQPVATALIRSAASRFVDGARRIFRYPLVSGLAVWAALLTVAYLVGTLAIAPMIGEAAGLTGGVYNMDSTPRATAKVSAEPIVQISPIATAPQVAAAPVGQKPDKLKPKRHRHRRHRTLPPDEVFLARQHHSGDEDHGDSEPKHEPSDDENRDSGSGGDSAASGRIQDGERLGDG